MNRRLPELGRAVKWRRSWWRPLLSGQSVDTCCQELNGRLPSCRDLGSGGSYFIQPLDLLPWTLEHLRSPWYRSDQGHETQPSCACDRRGLHEADSRSDGHAAKYLPLFATRLLLSCESPQEVAWTDSCFEASGELAGLLSLLQGNGRVRYLLRPVVSQKTCSISLDSLHGLRYCGLHLQSLLFACVPSLQWTISCCRPPAQRRIVTMDPNAAEWERAAWDSPLLFTSCL